MPACLPRVLSTMMVESTKLEYTWEILPRAEWQTALRSNSRFLDCAHHRRFKRRLTRAATLERDEGTPALRLCLGVSQWTRWYLWLLLVYWNCWLSRASRIDETLMLA